MLNIRELERRWLRYKIKSCIPYATIVLSIIVIAIVASIYFHESPSQAKPIHITQTQQHKSEKVEQSQIVKQNQQIKHKDVPSIQTVMKVQPKIPSKKAEQVVLKPSMDFMKGMQEISGGYYVDNSQQMEPKEETVQKTFVAHNTPSHFKQVTTPKTQPIPATKTQENKPKQSLEEAPKKIVITMENSMQDIKDAEKRFQKHNSPALSLFLARQYYKRGMYSKAYNYALITNQLDTEIEDSWLIFARSLVKLGKKQDAVKALREYIRFSHSNNATMLLNDIQTGKFQ